VKTIFKKIIILIGIIGIILLLMAHFPDLQATLNIILNLLSILKLLGLLN